MSDVCYQVGYIGVLDNEFNHEYYHNLFENDYETYEAHNLYFNYNNDIVYMVEKSGYIYDFEGIATHNFKKEDFLNSLSAVGLKLTDEEGFNIKYFFNVYYNGSDNPINLATKETYNTL